MIPTTLKTPGVYIDEKNAFPNSVVAVETAVPAFIGYTERAEFGGQSLKNKPVRIESFMEFVKFYGEDCNTLYDLSNVKPTGTNLEADFNIGEQSFWLTVFNDNGPSKFNLFTALKFFYQNGGGSCFIISIGSFKDTGSDMPFTSTEPFMKGIAVLKKETEPTMLVIPDAVLFKPDDCYSLQTQMLAHCAEQQNRVAILDIYDGDKGLDDPNYDPVKEFREKVAGTDSLKYGAAYYPWLHTTIVQGSDITHKNLSDAGIEKLIAICNSVIDSDEKLKSERKESIKNSISSISKNPPSVAMSLAQKAKEDSPYQKIDKVTALIKDRIIAENDKLDLSVQPDVTIGKVTKLNEAIVKLKSLQDQYNLILGDTISTPDLIKDSMSNINGVIVGFDSSIESSYEGLDAALKMEDDKDGATTKSDAIAAVKEAVKGKLDEVYNIATSAFAGDIATELGTANDALEKLQDDIKSADETNTNNGNDLRADRDKFLNSAKLELSDAEANLKTAISSLDDAFTSKDDVAIGQAKDKIKQYKMAIIAANDKLNLAKSPPDANTVSNALSVTVPSFKLVMDHILKKKNLLPPSAAMAGIYSLVDSQRGVWKAPANVAVNSVVSPAVLIDYEQQEDLNAPIQGKAICAIRPFIGLGTMVWGARTLDANSLDWRYMNVRRTMIMLEQSIKFAAKAYIFDPNVKNTWVSIEAMITNFLTNLWKLGALAGAVPTDAFSVSVGLGSTMTANDILEGRMNIEVRVAISHPAEFIVITFQQQQQKS